MLFKVSSPDETATNLHATQRLIPRMQLPHANSAMAGFRFSIVKIILLKSDDCILVLQYQLFCDAKEPVLLCKTHAF